MNLRRALVIVAFVLPTAAGPALAQAQPKTTPASPFDQPAANPFDQPPQQQGEPPCMKDFAKVRDDAEKHAAAVIAAQKNKAPLPEACKLLTAFAAAQDRFLTFAKKNATTCGIPPQLIQQISVSSANVAKARTKVCQMAAQPQRQQGPSLSDALGAPITDSSNIKTGRGTFDTLTGTPLGNSVK